LTSLREMTMAQTPNDINISGSVFAAFLVDQSIEEQDRASDESESRRIVSHIHPGSWSDVSRGALFEMEVERACSDPGQQAGHNNELAFPAEHYTDMDILHCAEFEDSQRRPCDVRDSTGQCADALNQTKEAEATSRDLLRKFTQRSTTTRSVPIPSRKQHLAYKRHLPTT
jgi:hypothetical protein